MRLTCIIIAGLTMALGLRMSSSRLCKKLGALTFISTMGYLGYALTDHWLGVLASLMLWMLLPLIEIYYHKGRAHYPLTPQPIPRLTATEEVFFPHASEYRAQLEELGFEEVDTGSWIWLDARQHHRFYWHPEHLTVASVCLSELDKIAFSYILFYSELACGKTLKTTNYPFTCTLQYAPNMIWRHVPCEEKKVPLILRAHQQLIAHHNTAPCQLRMPDPENVTSQWFAEKQAQISHNLSRRLISKKECNFHYTPLGFFHLWLQAIRDLIRLC